MKDGTRFVKTEDELRACYQLRYKVYVEGMDRFTDKSNSTLKELKDELDEHAKVVICIKNNTPVGTLRLFWGGDTFFTLQQAEAYHLSTFKSVLKEQQICIVERFMINDKYRGSMTALRMYQQVMDFVLSHQVEVVLLNCEPHHMSSYLKLGFKPFAKEYSYPGIGLVTPMALVVGDYEHLAKVGSPFSSLIAENNLSHCYHTEVLQKIINQEFESTVPSIFNKSLIINDFHKARDQLLTKRTRLFDSKLRMRLSAC